MLQASTVFVPCGSRKLFASRIAHLLIACHGAAGQLDGMIRSQTNFELGQRS
jgi:hypothetical protein